MKYDPEDTKRRVLKTAIDLFSKHGFESTMFKDIEDQAKVTRGNLTHHFGKKAELAMIVYDHVANELVATCSGPVERMTEDLMATVRALQGAYLDWMTTHPGKANLLRSLDVTISESQHEDAVPVRDRLIKLLRGWAKPQTDAGVFRRLSPAQLYAVIFGPIVGVDPGDSSIDAIEPAAWRDIVLEMAGAVLMRAVDSKPERPARAGVVAEQPSLFGPLT